MSRWWGSQRTWPWRYLAAGGAALVVLAVVLAIVTSDGAGRHPDRAGAARPRTPYPSPAAAQVVTPAAASSGPAVLTFRSAPNVSYLPRHGTFDRAPYAPDWELDLATSASGTGPPRSPELTVDLSGLAGKAEIDWVDKAWACSRSGLLVRCDLSRGTRWNFSPFSLRPAPGAVRGATARVTATLRAAGTPTVRHTTRVIVGAPVLTARERYPDLAGVRPGGRVGITPAFGNKGDTGVRGGVSVVVTAEGAAFVKRYRNCRYGTVGQEPRAQCDFPGPLAAGAAFETDAPLSATAGADTRSGKLSYFVYRTTDVSTLSAVPATAPHGTGAALRLRPVDGGPLTDRGDPARSDRADSFGVAFATTRVHDVTAVGFTIKGRVGQVVDLTVPYPEGDDWGAGGSRSATMRVVLPPGLTLVEVGPGEHESDIPYCYANPSGDGSVLCPGPAAPGTGLRVRVDRRVEGARGTVTVTSDPATDPDQADNTAPVTVEYLP
ncbi:hypothetical protein [Streptomyces tropicalis]|uniref:Uncharacterized protein n=1 Tax=Streptomyces tropicalis TaxID=3034234 RepID=A0ABT5ZYA1_9ACTN|nr:hypothetical protein [Streptomyces tropicalis]MDF3297373.1 hypothetical protein [Streptomyces tropicalis]